MEAITFQAWPKTPRLFRSMIITEKIDGTNGAIIITDDGQVAAQSRNRLVTPGDDNAGFAKWVADNAETLIQDLGPGRHFGEWWGKGIQRGYGMDCKVFSLFNALKYSEKPLLTPNLRGVPIIDQFMFGVDRVSAALERLRTEGSLAAPGFMKPEGIIVYHCDARSAFKVLLENDDIPKSLAG